MKQHKILLTALLNILLLFISLSCRKGPPTGTQKQEIEWINGMFIFEGDGGITDSIRLNKSDTLHIEVALINGNIIRSLMVLDEENYLKMRKVTEDYSAIFSRFLFTSGVFYLPIHSDEKYFFIVDVDKGIGSTKLHVKVTITRWE